MSPTLLALLPLVLLLGWVLLHARTRRSDGTLL